jgi:transposase
LAWQAVAYRSRNDEGKPEEAVSQYQVVEVTRDMVDEETGHAYPLRWIFVHSSHKAQQDAARRQTAVSAGEAVLSQIARRLGKYGYTSRAVIERRLQAALKQAKAQAYYQYTLSGEEGGKEWELRWERKEEEIRQAARFDGVTVLVTNVCPERLCAEGAMRKYREQVCVEQTIDFIKSPVQIRPMWLHKPKRLAGLLLLIMIAVLLSGLLEAAVRRWIQETGCLVVGLKPEGRDNAYPTAKAMLRAFGDYTLVVIEHAGGPKTIHYPRLRSVQQQIWDILKLPPLPGHTAPAGSGK